MRICVIIQPSFKTPNAHVLSLNFLQVLEPLARKILVISGNFPKDEVETERIKVINIKVRDKPSPRLVRIPNFILGVTLMEWRFARNLIKIAKEVDVVMFFIASTFVLPMLVAKLLRKKTIIIATGSPSETARKMFSQELFGLGGFIMPRFYGLLASINHALADRIIVYAESQIGELGLNKYRDKISAEGARFVETGLFKASRKLGDRRNLIGYIGRLSSEKGIINLVKAIPLILEKRSDVEFLIIGGGALFNEIEGELVNNHLANRVTLAGWIPHEKLPDYLSEMKLLILPSYTEGLPNVALEAMACGTPVLATPVGAVPDVIEHEKTGFILPDNSPESIASSIIEVLDYPKLEEIAKNASHLVRERFTYEAAVQRYNRILNELG